MQVTNDFELLTMLSNVEDPRRAKSTKHHLTDILFTALCGSMAGCDTWPEIVEFAKHRVEWFRRFIPLTNGIPSVKVSSIGTTETYPITECRLSKTAQDPGRYRMGRGSGVLPVDHVRRRRTCFGLTKSKRDLLLVVPLLPHDLGPPRATSAH